MLKLLVAFWMVNISLCSSPFPLEQDPTLFEGDLVLTPQQKVGVELSAAGIPTFAVEKDSKWPNPRAIPFRIHGDLNKYKKAKLVIADAIKEIEKHTCLRFIRKQDDALDGINFAPGLACSSGIGYSKSSISVIHLDKGCWKKGIVIHEIMHSLGFWHEQSRPDRDKYVTIKWGNILKGAYSQFKKHDYQRINSLGSPYDYDSIMHYGTYYFSIGGGKKSIETKHAKDQDRLGQREKMSTQDIFQINRIYCVDTKISTQSPVRKEFCIKHFGRKYLTVGKDGRTLVLSYSCKSKFTFLASKALQLVGSSLCIEPNGNENNALLELKKGCGINSRFEVTTKKSLKHVSSGKCIEPYKGATYPILGTKLAIYSQCDLRRTTFYLSEK